MPLEYKGLKISWLGHDTFRIKSQQIEVMIDPFQLKTESPVDVVFITHDHFDHCSLEDLKKVSTSERTTIIAATHCRKLIEKKLGAKEFVYVSPGDSGEVYSIRFKAVPAYNVNKFRSPGVPFHPKEYGGVGYVLEIGGVRLYHTGDSDHIEDMRGLGKVDVALIPVSGTYVMTAEEAARAVEDIKPELAIPMHFGTIVGSRGDAERFKKLASCRVEVLEKEE